MLRASATVLEAAMEAAPAGVSEQMTRSLLGAFLFRGDDVFKPVAVLSGGEKTRLALVKLLLDPPNLLLMDEPTTHLDIGSIDALIGALKQYEGTLIFISHDVHFIRSIADSVLHISAGKLSPYAGNYDYYLDKTRAVSARAALVAGSQLSDSRPPENKTRSVEKPNKSQEMPAESVPGVGLKEVREARKRDAADRTARAKEQRDLERALSLAETKVATLEKRQSELVAELEDPKSYEDPALALRLNRELNDLASEIEIANREWETLAERMSMAASTA
jgi:ATP-binding cassette subfamily F protein 3